MNPNNLTLADAMEAADILRAMLDDEQNKNELLKKRIKELEQLLIQKDICIPDYDLWHDPVLPMV